jgi:hypothetical protein
MSPEVSLGFATAAGIAFLILTIVVASCRYLDWWFNKYTKRKLVRTLQETLEDSVALAHMRHQLHKEHRKRAEKVAYP